jgi:hypothetical protein
MIKRGRRGRRENGKGKESCMVRVKNETVVQTGMTHDMVGK